MKRIALVLVVLAACSKNEPSPSGGPLEIKVTKNGFEPANLQVEKGKPVTIGITRTTTQTCATEIVMMVGDQKIERALPLDQRVEITTTFPQSGKIDYACAMDMIHGTITVQ